MSNLSFNMAKLCQSLGLTVIAGCLSKTSSGAQILGQLKQECNKQAVHVQELDITLPESIARLKSSVNEILQSSRGEFYALVNNAGFMTFGEFEWLTPELIRRQLEVNLIGTMNVTQSLLPLLRESSQQRIKNNQGSRIINVTSHCGIMPLPGLSVYAASKAGLLFYTNALRMELQQYNIQVVNFVPGSFVGQSGIALKQEEFAKEMWENLDDEQKEFYEEYFNRYNNYLSAAFRGIPREAGVVDPKIVKAFEEAISAKESRRRYLVEPLRYKIYHNLAKVLPDSRLRDQLVYKFTMMPRYKK